MEISSPLVMNGTGCAWGGYVNSDMTLTTSVFPDPRTGSGGMTWGGNSGKAFYVEMAPWESYTGPHMPGSCSHGEGAGTDAYDLGDGLMMVVDHEYSYAITNNQCCRSSLVLGDIPQWDSGISYPAGTIVKTGVFVFNFHLSKKTTTPGVGVNNTEEWTPIPECVQDTPQADGSCNPIP